MQSFLPPVLLGEDPMIAKEQQTEAGGSKCSAPGQEGQQDKEEQVGGPKPEAEAFDPPSKSTLVIAPRKSCKQVGNPIACITPLQFAKEIMDAGWILGEKLTPIVVEELPTNEFFFDKKRKVVLRQELYQEVGNVSKKYKILTDGKDMKKVDFATQIVQTLGAFARVNQYSVRTLKDQLKRKNRLIKTLETKLSTTEVVAKDQASATLE
jgi:hypothetical protein